MKSLTDADKSDKERATAAADDDEAVEEQQPRIVQTFHGSVLSLTTKKLPLTQRNTFLRITISILKEMANFTLLGQNVGFLLITLSNLFVFIGYFTPFLYMTKISEDNGMSAAQASFLISVVGK